MNVQAEKLKLIEWLVQLNDTSVLSQIKEIKDNMSPVENLSIISPDELKKRALMANQDIEDGAIYSLEDVLNEDWDQWSFCIPPGQKNSCEKFTIIIKKLALQKRGEKVAYQGAGQHQAHQHQPVVALPVELAIVVGQHGHQNG